MKRRSMRAPWKPFFLCLAAIAFLALAQVGARADEVMIVGRALGCFSAPGTTCAPGFDAQTANGGLVYRGSPFSGLTQDGVRGIGGNPAPIGHLNVNNLGSFGRWTFLEIDGTNLHKTKQEIRKLLKGGTA